MPHNSSKNAKQSPNSIRPFPWRCRTCGEQKVEEATTEYEATAQHDGSYLHIYYPHLVLPVCKACGAKVFTENVDAQINDALQLHLNSGGSKINETT